MTFFRSIVESNLQVTTVTAVRPINTDQLWAKAKRKEGGGDDHNDNSNTFVYRLYRSISISYSVDESDSRKISLKTGKMMSAGSTFTLDGSAT